jgi:hypothetical protein
MIRNDYRYLYILISLICANDNVKNISHAKDKRNMYITVPRLIVWYFDNLLNK